MYSPHPCRRHDRAGAGEGRDLHRSCAPSWHSGRIRPQTTKLVGNGDLHEANGTFKKVCVPRTPSVLITWPNRLTSAVMIALFCLFLALFASPFKSKSRLEAENAALRHQLIILRRKVRGRVRLTNGDRLILAYPVITHTPNM